MNKYFCPLIAYLIFFTCFTSESQNKFLIDSLQNRLNNSKSDLEMVNTLNDLSVAYRDVNDNDLKYALEALMLAKEINYQNGIVKAYVNLGTPYMRSNGEYEIAKSYYDSAVQICKKINDKILLADTYVAYGLLYQGNTSFYQNELLYYSQALKIYKTIKDTKKEEAKILNLISIVYQQIGEKDSSLLAQNQAVEILQSFSDKLELGKAYLYLADLNVKFEDHQSALDFINKSKTIYINYPNKTTIQYENDYAEFLLFMAEYYAGSEKPDSATSNFKNVINYINGLKKQKGDEYNNNINLANAFFGLGNIAFSKKESSNADMYYKKCILIYTQTEEFSLLGDKLQQIAKKYRRSGNLGIALEYYQEEIKVWEKIKNWQRLSNTYYLIGWVYESLGDYQKMLENCSRGLIIAERINSTGMLVLLNSNIAKARYFLANYDSAFISASRSLKINERFKDTLSIISNYNIIALVYEKRKEYVKAIELHTKVIDLKNRYGLGIATAYGTIATESSLARIYMQMKQYRKAIDYATQSLSKAKEETVREIIRDDCSTLAEIYETLGDNGNALKYYKQYIAVNDEILNDDIKKKVQQEEIKYITERKEQEILILNKEKQVQDTELKRQKFVSNTFLIGFIITLIFVFVFVWLFREKIKANRLLASQKAEILEKNEELYQLNEEILAQRDSLEEMNGILNTKNTQIEEQMQIVISQKKEISEKNEELQQLNEEITAQRDDIMEKNDILHRQNDEITAKSTEIKLQRDILSHQKQEIISSIEYAKKIQHAVLPSPEFFKENFNEHFVLFRPRNIVSGDFYWLKRVKNFIFFATADCTGHGVPGAFMSMLGMSFLNEIVVKSRLDSSGEVLNNLRKKIKTALHQDGTELEQKDGMDIALCLYDLENNTLQYSGAYNSLYLIRNKELIEYKADRQPCAIYLKETEFSSHEISLQKGDLIYTFSDGYSDQTGGEQNRKYMSKNFKQFLIDISHEPMDLQKELLEQNLENWKKGSEQIDDILVVGIKIS